jgi:hypothetical protein
MSMLHCSLLSLGCASGFAPPAQHSTLTALRALKIAQRRLRPEVRAKLLAVSSARSDQSLLPPAWRFVFSDPATSGQCRVVTVAAKASSEHPSTVDAFAGTARTEDAATTPVIPQAKLQVDSDKALEKIRASSKLKGAQAVEFSLIQPKRGQEPTWIVHIFGDKGTALARFRVGAKTGDVEQKAE